MLKLLKRNLRRLRSYLRCTPHRSSKQPKIVITHLGKSPSKPTNATAHNPKHATVHPNSHSGMTRNTIRVATFNAALFSMAPACHDHENTIKTTKSVADDRPKSILKQQSPLHPRSENNSERQFAKTRLRVSINLPDNEISLRRSKRYMESGEREGMVRTKRAVVDVLSELDADILALQDVRADEEKEMKPLSDLAAALGMNYVFAESWAPEYGNAVLSKWPIKKWKVQRICDDTDFRNVLKTTIEVPEMGYVNFYCTHLDHLDEKWRMKQINSIIQSNDAPHILAGGLNSLDESDYLEDRWTDIIKYYEEIGKPRPQAEVMRFLKSKQYVDSKDFAGECESVVMIAKGQSVQGTCKYGTRLDYILASPGLPYKFVPGTYSVISSKGTSDHHIVKVDIAKIESIHEIATKKKYQQPKRIVKITDSSFKGI